MLYYTDGHAVTVTDTVLQVNRKWYSLSGITKHGFLIIPPMRLPGIVLMATGLVLFIIGMAGFLPSKLTGITMLSLTLNVNDLSIAAGVLLLVPGIGMMVLIRERYAVCITTAEGEKNVVVSKKKEYISQIVGALNEAFFARLDAGQGNGSRREFTVSGR